MFVCFCFSSIAKIFVVHWNNLVVHKKNKIGNITIYNMTWYLEMNISTRAHTLIIIDLETTKSTVHFILYHHHHHHHLCVLLGFNWFKLIQFLNNLIQQHDTTRSNSCWTTHITIMDVECTNKQTNKQMLSLLIFFF